MSEIIGPPFTDLGAAKRKVDSSEKSVGEFRFGQFAK
jgi:hypothetical protein